jgi:sugar lactone lactonase YvrE
MKIKQSKHLTSTILILAIFSLFSIISSGTPHAAMPDYQWQESIAIDAPTAVDTDQNGNIYIAESSNNRLNIINSAGILQRTLRLDTPTSVAIYEGQGSGKKIFVGNRGKGNVEVYDDALNLMYKLGSGDGEFIHPNAIAISENGNVYVTDGKGDTVKIYSLNGTYQASFGTTGSGDGEFNYPIAIAIDEIAGEVVVTDLQVTQGTFGSHAGARVQVFDLNGSFKRSFGEYGIEEGMLFRPIGIEVDSEGRIYVSDTRLQAVQIFDSSGTYLGAVYNTNNPMRTPLGINLDSNNRLYVASLTSSSVEVYQIGNPAPDITVTPESHNFGEIETGSSSSAIFTVENSGTADLVIDTVNPPVEPFSITSDTCSGQDLVPEGNCAIEVTFAPTEAATFAGNVTIQSRVQSQYP